MNVQLPKGRMLSQAVYINNNNIYIYIDVRKHFVLYIVIVHILEILGGSYYENKCHKLLFH